MARQKAAELGGGDHAFADANEEGFEGRAFGMSRASTRGAFRFPCSTTDQSRSAKKERESWMRGS
jgi:hypothetical protein